MCQFLLKIMMMVMMMMMDIYDIQGAVREDFWKA